MCLKSRRIIRQTIVWIIFIIYISGLVYFLFFAERYGRQEVHGYRYNLEPFAEIKRYLQYYKTIGIEHFMLNIIGNVLAFVPYGFCVPLLSSACSKRFFTVLLSGLLFTFSIETVQLIMRVGSFDVDDIILNTTGVILGYILFIIIRLVYRLSRR